MKTKTKKPVKTKAAKAAKVSPGAKLLRKICEGEIEHYRREVDAWAHDKEQRHVSLALAHQFERILFTVGYVPEHVLAAFQSVYNTFEEGDDGDADDLIDSMNDELNKFSDAEEFCREFVVKAAGPRADKQLEDPAEAAA
jgi:hypothetical protein